jgi:RNA polymerase sigma factor (sigma-70 family)
MYKEETFLNELKKSTPKLKAYSQILTLRDESDLHDDLFQDTVLQMIEKIELFDGKNLTSWGSKIMKNIYLNLKQRNVVKLKSDEYLGYFSDRVSYNNGDEFQVMGHFNEALNNLTNQPKKIIHMRYAKEMKFQEIADELGISCACARSTHSMHIGKVREELKEYIS